MKKIVLICSGGMSTSLLVNSMRERALVLGIECEIEAYSVSERDIVSKKADILLLGPQAGYLKEEFEVNYPNTPVIIVDTEDFSLSEGDDVFDKIRPLIEEE